MFFSLAKEGYFFLNFVDFEKEDKQLLSVSGCNSNIFWFNRALIFLSH